MALGFTGEQHDAQIERRLQIGRQRVQHRQAAADVKTADDDIKTAGAEFVRHVHGAGELVGLHADQKDDPAPAWLIRRATRSGEITVLHSSHPSRVISTSGPSTRRSAASSTMAYRLASEFAGMEAFHHWIT